MIGRLLSFVRLTRRDAKISDVKIDTGGSTNITCEDFRPAGDDGHPLTTDYVTTTPIVNSGGEVIVGYVDPINEAKAQPGEKRIYARETSEGKQISEVWLKNDGNILISNDKVSVTIAPDGSITGANNNGSFALIANGDFSVNGVVIDSAGNVTIPTSLKLGGKEINNHTHPISWTDPAGSGTSGPNT